MTDCRFCGKAEYNDSHDKCYNEYMNRVTIGNCVKCNTFLNKELEQILDYTIIYCPVCNKDSIFINYPGY